MTRNKAGGGGASDGAAVVTLREPIESGGQRVERVTMRRPLVRDLRAAQRAAGGRDAAGADVEFRLFANLCEMAPETLDAMAVADYLRLQEAYAGFLSPPSTSAPPALS